MNKIELIEPYEIQFINEKYKCCNCNFFTNNIEILDKHLKFNCIPTIKYNNIYKFEDHQLAKHIFQFSENAGEIYIVKFEKEKDNLFKIGISSNLFKRLATYRTNCIYEPKLYYYFPCKNIKLADKIIKINLKKYNIKKE